MLASWARYRPAEIAHATGALSFLGYFRVFLRLARGKFLLLPLLAMVSGAFEGVGIVLFFPLFEQLQLGGAATTGDRTLGALSGALMVIGIQSVPGILGLIAGIFIVKFVVVFAQSLIGHRIVRRIYEDLAARIVRGWEAADYHAFFLAQTTGYFPNLLLRELLGFTATFDQYSTTLVGILYALISLSIALFFDPIVTIIAVVFGGASFLLLQSLNERAKQYSLALTDQYTGLQSRIIEFAESFKFLKATDRFGPGSALLRRGIHAMLGTRFRMSVISGFFTSLSEPLVVLLVTGFIALELVVFQRPFALIAVLVLLFYRILMRMMSLQTSLHKLAAGSGSVRVVLAALDRLQGKTETRGAARFSDLQDRIALTNVCFAYDATGSDVITGLTMEIPRRHIVALVGASGGGKSTIIDLVTGVLTPRAGSVTVDGNNHRAMDLRSYRRRLGYVSQDVPMFHDTIANNVSLWDPDASQSQIVSACAQASAAAFIEALPEGYETIVGDRGIRLSSGQRQRIAIARELYRDPDILLFDEVTSALDTESEAAIRSTIVRLRGTKTILLVAHRLSTVRDADYVYVIAGGRVAEEGTFDALFHNERSIFHRMCALQEIR